MIRYATKDDLPAILAIVKDAKVLFSTHGSNQWHDEGGYPNKAVFRRDIAKNILYVYEENKQVVAMAAISHEEEETYRTIYEGKWLSNDNALAIVIHRLAIKKEFYRKGIAKRLFQFAETLTREKNYRSIRIDTHEKNQEMLQLLSQVGYHKCGIIYLERNGVFETKRWAYEKEIKPVDTQAKALIFDMDGTMIDTMRYWYETGEQVFREIFQDADFFVHSLLDTLSAWDLVFQLFDSIGDKEGKRAILKKWHALMQVCYFEKAALYEGLVEVLEYYYQKKIPMCVATGTNLELAQPILEKMGILHYFEFIATEEMVGKSKRHPDLFLYAAEKLGVSVQECLVFEDSFHAARTAYHMGIPVVGIYDEVSKRSAMRLKNYCADYIYSYIDYLHKIKKGN